MQLPERLDFRLPDFARLSWVSEAARARWAPRLGRIAVAWAELEWRSVAAGIRPCALLRIPLDRLAEEAPRWVEASLWSLPLRLEGGSPAAYSSTPAPPSGRAEAGDLLCLVLGSRPDVLGFRAAWDAGDDTAMGELLGYPTCCREFFRQVWVEGGCLDTTWPMASNTLRPVGRSLSLAPAGPPWANVLCRWLGARAVPHLPCRFNCAESVALGERLVALGRELGFAAEVGWLREILDWPLEWSALHGIAEIRTPVLRVSARTDATAEEYVVRWQGGTWPEEGAAGLRVPYRPPARPPLTASLSFRRGLAEVGTGEAPQPWHYADNGFASAAAMEAAHAPLVALAREALEGVEAGTRVLDLGCGNGALLRKLCAIASGLVPHGIDINAGAIAHAKVLLPEFAGNFLVGDLVETERWRGGNDALRYRLTLLMPGRLVDGGPATTAKVLDAVAASSERLLVYAYPGYSADGLEGLARRAGLSLAGPSQGHAAWAVLH